ncbi:MAG: hypothetical protein F4W92_00745 [Gammaproteobacteria bacterium]|nr:hypothetical protein [Gammaproteobacteria bacterium]
MNTTNASISTKGMQLKGEPNLRQTSKKPILRSLSLLVLLIITLGVGASSKYPPVQLPGQYWDLWGNCVFCDNTYIVCFDRLNGQEPHCVEEFELLCHDDHMQDAEDAEHDHRGADRQAEMDAYTACIAEVPDKCTVDAQCLRTWLECRKRTPDC